MNPLSHFALNFDVRRYTKGTFHVHDAVVENLVLARRKAAAAASEVDVLNDGKCMFSRTSAVERCWLTLSNPR